MVSADMEYFIDNRDMIIDPIHFIFTAHNLHQYIVPFKYEEIDIIVLAMITYDDLVALNVAVEDIPMMRMIITSLIPPLH